MSDKPEPREGEVKKGGPPQHGSAYDPAAEPDEEAKEATPHAIEHGTPVSDDELRELKRKAETEFVKRTISPQKDDSTPQDENESPDD